MATGDKKPVLMQADIGADGGVAPAGYGYGDMMSHLDTGADETEEEEILSAQFNALGTQRTIQFVKFLAPPRGTYGLALCKMCKPGAMEYGSVEASIYGQYFLKKAFVNGQWQPWEWVNPPMELGEEYRTTERYLKKPVYTKLVSFGAMPSAAYKTIEHGIADVERCVYAGGTCGAFNLQGLKGVTAVDCGDTSIGIGTDNDTWTSYEAQVLMKYTKTTD